MKRFDDLAKTWDINPDKLQRAKTFAKKITAYIPPSKKLNALEFGCGTGLLSFALKDAFKTITLVDTSVGMIDVLKNKITQQQVTNFKPMVTDLLEDAHHITNIDVIFTLMTLHHIHDLKKAFTEFHKILNPNGYVCIADLVEEDGTFHKPELKFDGHLGFNKEQLIDLLQDHGFLTTYYSTPHTIVKDSGREYPLFLLIAKKSPDL